MVNIPSWSSSHCQKTLTSIKVGENETSFADTGYWVALLNPRDQLHQKSRELSQKMGSLYIFTSESTKHFCRLGRMIGKPNRLTLESD